MIASKLLLVPLTVTRGETFLILCHLPLLQITDLKQHYTLKRNYCSTA